MSEDGKPTSQRVFEGVTEYGHRVEPKVYVIDSMAGLDPGILKELEEYSKEQKGMFAKSRQLGMNNALIDAVLSELTTVGDGESVRDSQESTALNRKERRKQDAMLRKK